MFVVMRGNLTEGFKPLGPFEDFEDAAEASEGIECWIMLMQHPDCTCDPEGIWGEGPCVKCESEA